MRGSASHRPDGSGVVATMIRGLLLLAVLALAACGPLQPASGPPVYNTGGGTRSSNSGA